jgi:hypothetical protein
LSLTLPFSALEIFRKEKEQTNHRQENRQICDEKYLHETAYFGERFIAQGNTFISPQKSQKQPVVLNVIAKKERWPSDIRILLRMQFLQAAKCPTAQPKPNEHHYQENAKQRHVKNRYHKLYFNSESSPKTLPR